MARQNSTEKIPGIAGVGLGGPAARFAPHQKAKDARGTFRKLLKFYLKEAKSLFVVLILLLADTVIVVSGPYFVGKAVSAMTGGVKYDLAYMYAAILCGVYLFSWAFNVTQGLIMNTASQKIVRTLRKSLFDKLQKLPLAYHDTHAHGELMSRLTNDIDNISVTIAQSTTQLASAVITVFGSLLMMSALSVYMTLAALVTVPLVVLLTKIVAGKSKKMFSGQQRELGKLNGMVEEAIAGKR